MEFSTKLQELGFKSTYVLDGNVVSVSVAGSPNDEDLLFNVHRLVLRLLQNLRQTLTTSKLCLGCLIQVGTELGERLQLAELGQVDDVAFPLPASLP